MSWLKNVIPPKIKRIVGSVSKKNIPEGLWCKCPSCQAVLYRTDLEQNMEVCPKCSFHNRISARSRIDTLLDKDKRKEIGISDDLVRLSVGIEDIEDLLEDLTQALK